MSRRSLTDAGVGVSIVSGGFENFTEAKVYEQSFAGPVALGTILVHQQPVRPGIAGAPVVFSGEHLALTLQPNVARSSDGTMPARLKAEIKGRIINQALKCQFLAHTL